MSKIVIVDEKYIAEYYSKRQQLNKLKDEVEEMSEIIKVHLEKKYPIGRTYGEYTVCLHTKNKLNSNFIRMLKENNMQDRIIEVCYVKDCKDIIAAFTKEDENKYYDFWYKQLFVRKIK